MGNNIDNTIGNHIVNNKIDLKLLLKKKLRNGQQQKKQKKEYFKFFTEYHKSCKSIDDITQFNLNRLVFISIYGLYRTWKQCPSILLYNAIFILPIKQIWIEKPTKYQSQHEYYNLLEDDKFRILLQWKQSQKLLFCTKDYHNYNDNDTHNDKDKLLVSPIWTNISDELQKLYDPISKNKYKPLIFDAVYWKYISSTNKSHDSQCNISYHDIMLELFHVTMRYKTIQKIFIESNPTLNVVTCYDIHNIHNTKIRYRNNHITQQCCSSKEPILPCLDYNSYTPYSPCTPPGTPLSEQIDDKLNRELIKEHKEHEKTDTDNHDQQIETKIILDCDWWIADDYFDDDDDEMTLNENDNLVMTAENC